MGEDFEKQEFKEQILIDRRKKFYESIIITCICIFDTGIFQGMETSIGS